MNPIVLMLLPYLQSWDGARLLLRLLALPRVNPLDPLISGADPPGPSFATAALRFDVRFIPGLDAMPTPTSPVTSVELASPAPLVDPRALFAALEALFPIDPAAGPGTPRRPGVTIHKYAPASYRVAVGHASSRTPLLVTDDSYHCAVTAAPSKGYAKLPPPAPLPWGKVLAICLRQPALAEALGLVRPLTVTLPDPSLLSDGGWVSVSLAPGSDAHALVTTDSVVSYAARIPPLVEPRPLFTSVLFPSTPSSTAGYDELFQEVIDYDDGFAKAVHTGQPQTLDPLLDGDDGSRPVRDLGMRIGWDDEQVTIWLNRQIDPGAAALDAPMGVFGYRVDVRLEGTDEWSSLCRAAGPVAVGDLAVGQFDGELAVETIATQLEGERTGPYWLPIYYTQWTGPPLVGGDAVATRLAGHPVAAGTSGVTGLGPDVELRYGQTYEVRVRLMDHTGGGPDASATPRNPAPHPVETMPFRRWVPPGRLVLVDPPPVTPDPANAPTTLTLRRPLLGYPASAFTAVANPIPALIADLPTAKDEEREVGLPDPDVDRALIVVEVQMPDAVGAADHVPLYSTTRAFPADPAEPLTVELEWVDVHDASTVVPGAIGPLPIPTARPVRISVAAQCRADPDLEYFGAADVMTGPLSFVSVRRESADERALLKGGAPAVDVTAMFQRGVAAADGAVAAAQRASGHGREAPDSPEHRLAATMRLQISGLTVRGQPGRRSVFGCSSGIRHLLAPDASAVTFASRAELADRWIVAVRATLDRDWSWDALGPEGVAVVRDGTVVGQLTPTRSVHEEATRDANRSETDLIFFDVVDPRPAPGAFPDELEAAYRLEPRWMALPSQVDPVSEQAVRLPVTTPPSQVPKLASAGIALSPYERTPAYDRSLPRRRLLWLEFAERLLDPGDGLFCRVLAHAADPTLLGSAPDGQPPLEPPLPVDPEPIRVIVPGQSDDRAGLGAMQPLISSDSPRHFGLPLPPGMEERSPELFGLFTYEFRIGHVERWSTANGRFGAPLRVTAVQHPVPALDCAVTRDAAGIEASAAFADPVSGGRSWRPTPPITELWVMIYAQVRQLDGETARNVLLSHRAAVLRRAADHDRALSGVLYGTAAWSNDELALMLDALTLGTDTPLSCLAAETLPGHFPQHDPLGADLGHERLVRTSPLVPVPAIC